MQQSDAAPQGLPSATQGGAPPLPALALEVVVALAPPPDALLAPPLPETLLVPPPPLLAPPVPEALLASVPVEDDVALVALPLTAELAA